MRAHLNFVAGRLRRLRHCHVCLMAGAAFAAAAMTPVSSHAACTITPLLRNLICGDNCTPSQMNQPITIGLSSWRVAVLGDWAQRPGAMADVRRAWVYGWLPVFNASAVQTPSVCMSFEPQPFANLGDDVLGYDGYNMLEDIYQGALFWGATVQIIAQEVSAESGEFQVTRERRRNDVSACDSPVPVVLLYGLWSRQHDQRIGPSWHART